MVVQDKVIYRRRKILELRAKGFTNVEISHKLRYSLSTIEKDLQKLRKISLRRKIQGVIVY
jgi:DNA-binding NarL/FixJ family response regulator